MRRSILILAFLGFTAAASADDWRQFRGPGGLGVSSDKNLPAEWSSAKNIVWKTKLPGPGASSPIIVKDRVYITSYTGYGVQTKEPGEQADLRRHLLCVDRKDGAIKWSKVFEPSLPEHKYAGEGAYHGYAASTPASDGERLYVFFGKSGLFCFDLDGKKIWEASAGKNIHGAWGSGASPMFFKDLVILNAAVESGAVIAFDKFTGAEKWRAPKMGNNSWGTPVLVTTPEKTTELVVSVSNRVIGLDPDTGKELWTADGIHSYVCPSVIAHDGIVYATGGGSVTTAIKTGGRGDVTKTHVLWRAKKGSNTPSPVYHDGYLYFANTKGGTVTCLNASTGDTVYQERLKPNVDTIYGSPVLADGKLYYATQHQGTFVLAVGPKFELLANNVFQDDKSRTNGSIAVSNGQLFLRTDENLYCIGQEKGKKSEAKKKPNVYTDIADAPIDYKIQGEYAGASKEFAAQVVARGNGKFDIYLLKGGLPGAGWDPKSKRIKIETKLDPGKESLSFAGNSANESGGYVGSIDAKAGTLTLTNKAGGEWMMSRAERKSPTLGAKPPEGAIILFDGKNADAWNPGKMTGDLLSVPNTTKKSFKNFNLHVEFRTPFEPFAGGQGRGNSGVYVCGREVQVLDSFGLKGDKNECGAIYNECAPSVNMCLPPLTWQTYDIQHRSGKIDPDTKKQSPPTITVRHNGVVVIDNFELKGGANQGSIFLQDHGNPVVYRNIWLAELK